MARWASPPVEVRWAKQADPPGAAEEAEVERTAREIIDELQQYNEAYVWYLATTYLPLALEVDPTFGFQRAELAAALRSRIGRLISGDVRDACERLLRSL